MLHLLKASESFLRVVPIHEGLDVAKHFTDDIGTTFPNPSLLWQTSSIIPYALAGGVVPLSTRRNIGALPPAAPLSLAAEGSPQQRKNISKKVQSVKSIYVLLTHVL